MDLSGKVAIVTGGASGLGRATVEAYVAKGVKVAIFDMNEDTAKEVMDQSGADSVAFWNVNVADENSVKAAVEGVVEKYGAIHICNNYAGIGNAIKKKKKKGVFPLEDYMKIINVNLVGTFNVSRYAAEQMANNEPINNDGGRGVIINTASVAAYEGQIGQAAYSASKGGIVGMTLPIARDLSSIGVRCNTIVPGLIHTPLFQGAPQNVIDALAAQVLYPKRLGTADEIAHVAVMLMENEYMNGECVRMDGGIRMQPR